MVQSLSGGRYMCSELSEAGRQRHSWLPLYAGRVASLNSGWLTVASWARALADLASVTTSEQGL